MRRIAEVIVRSQGADEVMAPPTRPDPTRTWLGCSSELRPGGDHGLGRGAEFEHMSWLYGPSTEGNPPGPGILRCTDCGAVGRPEEIAGGGRPRPPGWWEGLARSGWAVGSRMLAMKTTALADGDVHWVFPAVVNPDGIQALLREASDRIEALAGHLGVRPGWTGSGLEFHDVGEGAVASLFGCAEVDEVSFILDLERRRGGDRDRGSAMPWDLEAAIAVRCDHVVDCGMHTIEERTASFDAPLDAARGLVEAAAWLLERGTAEALSSWRGRDEEPGERRSAG